MSHSDILKFQAVDWREYNEVSVFDAYDGVFDGEGTSEGTSDSDSEETSRLVIRCFGRTMDGKSVTISIEGFTVYFYIKVPDNYHFDQKMKLKKLVDDKIAYRYKSNFLGVEYVKSKDIYGFTNEKQFKFLKFSFNHSMAMSIASGVFANKVRLDSHSRFQKFQLYESNVHPIVRFFHTQNVKPFGWIQIDKKYLQDTCNCQTDLEYSVKWNKVLPFETEEIAPLRQASFDIEVYSQYITRGKVLSFKFVDKKIDNNYEDGSIGENFHDNNEIEIVGDDDCNYDEILKEGFPIECMGYSLQVTNVIKSNCIRAKFLNEKDQISTENLKKRVEKYKKYNRNFIEVFRDQDVTKVKDFPRKRMFPSPNVDGNYVTQIGTAFKIQSQDDFYLKHIICLKQCAPIDQENTIVECYDTEKEVLIAFKNLLIREDPDFIYSYNGDCFDFNYLDIRAKILGISPEFLAFSRIKDYSPFIKHEVFSSSAYGTTHYYRMNIDGRVNFDLLIYVKRTYKLNSYKLDTIAELFLKQKKHDVSPAQIFDYWQEGTPEKIKTVAEYCIQDTLLPQRIIDKKQILAEQIEMANVSYVPFRFLLERGQQIKVFSLILKYAKENGYLIPHFKRPYYKEKDKYYTGTIVNFNGEEFMALKNGFKGQPPKIPLYEKVKDTENDNTDNTDKNDEEEEEEIPTKLNSEYWKKYEPEAFKGATVLEPKKGAYWQPVTVLDFASLYPSIIVSSNLCYSTLVMDPKYDNLSGVDYLRVSWQELNKKGELKKYNFSIVQNQKGIVPELTKILLSSRKRVKKMMAVEKDPFLKNIYNVRQKALKVTCNSVYGFYGSQTIPCKSLASIVTNTGRSMIDNTKKYCETEFKDYIIKEKLVPENTKVQVVYGDTDSVFVLFDTGLPRDQAMKKCFEIGSICGKMATEKLFKPPNDLEFEKVYLPLLLYGKKRYIGQLYETSPDKPDYVDYKGVELTRRDNANIVKIVYQKLVDIIIEKEKEGVQLAIDCVNKELDKLINNKFDISDLTITKSLRDKYKINKKEEEYEKFRYTKTFINKSSKVYKDPNNRLPNIGHVLLADKMKKRDPASAPTSGDRIPFVFVEDPINPTNTKIKSSERCEDPEYVIQNKLKLDIIYYIENQLKNPLCQFFGLLIDKPEKIFENAKQKYIKKRSGQKDIRSFFS